MSTATTDTFVTDDGMVVRYQDVFAGILSNVERYGRTSGRALDGEDLKDTFQNAALKAVRSHGSFDPGLSSPSTWGSRIAGNCEKDTYREADRRGRTFTSLVQDTGSAEASLPQPMAAYRSDEFEADCAIRSSEAESLVWEKIGTLNRDYQRLLILRIEGMKSEEMAKAVGREPEYVYRTLNRARKALARALGKDFLAEYGLAC